MAIIGFICVLFAALYLVVTGVVMAYFSTALGNKKEALISLVPVLLGLGLLYIDFVNAPFKLMLQ